MGRPRKEDSLTRQDVVAAATACIDKEGEAALGVNRVARELGIKPPAMYKHVRGNEGLRQACAIAIWRSYLNNLDQQLAGITEPQALLVAGAHATRNYAKQFPARYMVMMSYQLKPSEPEEAEIIARSLQNFRDSLNLHNLSEDTLIDIMRMINAAIYGFIIREQSDLMTLRRSPDDSYEVMLEALLIATQHIQKKDVRQASSDHQTDHE
ncbi:MAG: WHG domain-containing protein [Cyanobacteria bacterium J06631_12]